MRQKEILDAATDTLTQEQEQEFDNLHDEEQRLMRQAGKIEEAEKRELEQEQADEVHDSTKKKKEHTAEQKRELEKIALREFLATGAVSPELRSFMKPAKADKDDASWIDRELNQFGIVRAAQQSTTDGSGGYTIPQGFQAELERAVLAFGGMFEAARTWRTTTGNPVDWPTVNDTMNEAYQLSEAANAETNAVKITDASQSFEAYKFTSGLIRVSSELIQDSAFDMPSLINELLSERMFRGGNRAFTIGDGSTKPKGVVDASVYGYSTEADGAISADDILELEHSVDPAYRNMAGTRFMMHDSVLKAIKKFSVASTNLYPIWLPSLRDAAPATILNHPYTINQHMASFIGTGTAGDDNKKIMLFGDFKKYIIRQVQSMRMVRLNERFGDTDEVGFVLFWRWDGDLLDAGTRPIKHLRVSTT